MKALETRTKARIALSGKWGKSALLTLIYMLLIGVCSFISNLIPLVGPLVLTIISIPLSYGFIVSLIKLSRNEKIGYLDFFENGFNSFGKVWMVQFNVILKLLPYVLLFILSIIIFTVGIFIVGISMITLSSDNSLVLFVIVIVLLFVSSILLTTKSLYYSLSKYILYDNPNLSPKEIVKKSKELMTGNRLSLFCLSLSFIGWALLCSITLGIGYFWLIPYMGISTMVFYENLRGDIVKETTPTDEEVNEENIIE